MILCVCVCVCVCVPGVEGRGVGGSVKVGMESKFHCVACETAIVLPGENPLWRKKTAIQNHV